MSTSDLEFLPGLPKLKMQSSSSKSNNENSSEEVDNNNVGAVQSSEINKSEEECVTPKSEEHRIPAILSCPPAPKKPLQRPISCKRKLVFFEVSDVGLRDEVDEFLRLGFEAVAKRRNLAYVNGDVRKFPRIDFINVKLVPHGKIQNV
ncbi:hypothetical protein RJ641_036362 [Dillenia turbinata]|uniref:Uncharacterized protein n=1 Tax=Dillenia turbinata TaxID=194707 RepID=A0AAN8ZGV0_9MAGN